MPPAAPAAPARPSALDTGRIAARYACRMLTRTEAIALLQRAGCTFEAACGHLAHYLEA